MDEKTLDKAAAALALHPPGVLAALAEEAAAEASRAALDAGKTAAEAVACRHEAGKAFWRRVLAETVVSVP